MYPVTNIIKNMNNQIKLGNDILNLTKDANKLLNARRRDNILGIIFVSVIIWSIFMAMLVIPAWRGIHN